MIYSNKLIKLFSLLCVLLIFTGCGGSENGGGDIIDPVPPPKATTLVFPLQNSECNEGVILSETQSRVTFEWNTSEDTDSYTLVLTNLLDNTTKSTTTSNTTKDENILRGVPYSWYVTSKANGNSTTADSPSWRFYNAGVAVENYAPFPAELVSPVMGSLTTTSATLEWIGSDLDNDIESYDVYLGTNNPPTTLHENTNNTTSNTSSLNVDTVYYWSVTTKDGHGNNSQSPVFEFRTQ